MAVEQDILCPAAAGRAVIKSSDGRHGAVVLYVFNWAAENPDKVACVYVDNPVLDLQSWPRRIRCRAA